MSLEEILSVKLTVASRTETTALDAPSVVSVFTSEDFRRMGARDLRDVLRTVPGFELGVRGQLGYPEFGLRGVVTDNTEKIRFLLDGVAVNENLEGSGTIIFGDMALDNVQQIEIIRGPGSALYGTNAFVGVVSIITKDASSSGAHTTISARGGSFNTSEGSVLSGWSGPKLRVSGYLHYLTTDGPASSVKRDALQVVDASPWFSSLNSGISLAGTGAGHTDEFRRELSAQLKVDYQGFYFNGVFTNAHKGPYLGTYFSVNEHSDAHPYQVQGTVGYLFHPNERWVIEPKVYFLHYEADNQWNDAPPGYRMPDGNGGTIDYTKGSYQINQATQGTRGVEAKATWNLAQGERMVFGGSVEEERLYHIVNYVNVPGFGLDNLVETPPIMKESPARSLSSAYIQYQGTIMPTLDLTLGGRMDHYNDAGTSLTPRLALVWRPDGKFHLKTMYGEAFRAPTFVESYLFAAGGFVRGRKDNQPEKIRTVEVEAGYRFGDRALWNVVLFQNRITNLLKLTPVAGGLEYQNLPDATVIRGFETELKLTFSPALGGFLNYSTQSGHNRGSDERVVGMANWRGNIGFNVNPLDEFTFSVSLNVVGPRLRVTGDPRPELKGYQVLDMALTYAVAANAELSLTAHNLFDGDQRFPSVSVPLPGDFPGEGRNIQAGIRWHF